MTAKLDKRFWGGCYYIWKYRELFFPLISDFPIIIPQISIIFKAYSSGLDGVESARNAFTTILNLESISILIQAMVEDKEIIKKLSDFFNNTESFTSFWQIILGKSLFRPNRWERFFSIFRDDDSSEIGEIGENVGQNKTEE